MSTPLISVIIPVYNMEKYLRECLDSVINQTLKDIEIICVDDGSTDNSLEILKEYAKKDKRLKVFTQKNKGAGAARNLGLTHATGEYLAFLDGDDYYSFDFANKMYTKAKEKDLDILICSAQNYNIKTNTYQTMPWSLNVKMLPENDIFSVNDIKKYIFNFSQNWNWNKIFKKSFIDKNNIKFQELYRTNDLLFTNKALVLAKKISTIQEDLVTYRIGMESNSQATNHLHPEDFLKAFHQLKLFLDEEKQFNKLKQSFYSATIGGIVYNYNSIKFEGQKKSLINQLQKKWIKLLGLDKLKENDVHNNMYQKYLSMVYNMKQKTPFYQKLFSIKNSNDKQYKIVYLLGLRIKFKRKKFGGCSLVEHLLSIKNSKDKRYKIIRLCGLRVKIRNSRFIKKISKGIHNFGGKITHILTKPIRVQEKYHHLKQEYKRLKNLK